MLRDDADDANNGVKRTLEVRASQKVSVAGMSRTPESLEFVPIKVHKHAFEALKDSTAVPNVISPAVSELLLFTPLPTPKRLTRADGSVERITIPDRVSSKFVGALKEILTTCRPVQVLLY